MQIGHVEAPGRVLVQLVAAVTANPLVTTGAERPRAGPGEDDDPDRLVLPGEHERPVDLDQGLRTERVVHLGTVDGDLRSESTRLNSSHVKNSYAVFCLKKKMYVSCSGLDQ